MASTPSNPHTNRGSSVVPAGAPPTIVVWLGPDGGTEPTESDEVDWLIPLRIIRRAGSEPDLCEFEIDLGKTGDRVVDQQIPVGFARRVQVRTTDEIPLFWGDLTLFTQQIVPDDGEHAFATGRVEDFLFGNVLTGYRVWDPINNAIEEIEDDPAFNPLIDGVVEPNRRLRDTEEDDNSLKWVDPESVRTAGARATQDTLDAEEWTLKHSIEALCHWLNKNETHIKNPEDLADAIDDDEAPKPKDLTLKRGQYLPDYLDDLLHPHGYDWYLDLAMSEPSEEDPPPDPLPAPVLEPRIAIFQRAKGEEREVYFQRPGETLDLAESNAPIVAIDTSVVDLANKIKAYGGVQEREITIELKPAWDPGVNRANDKLSADDLHKEDGASYKGNEDVWRLWVVSEAGDYTDLRSEIGAAPNLGMTTPSGGPTALEVFDGYVPRRRKFEACLTLDDQGKRRRPLVEWSDDGGVSWKELPPGSGYVLLSDQLGLRFDGDTPPDDVMQADHPHSVGNSIVPKIRVTGTVAGDQRLFKELDITSTSPQERDVVLWLDVSDRFFDRKRQDTGLLKSVLISDPPDPDEADEQTDGVPVGSATQSAIEEYLDKIKADHEAAAVRVDLHLFGLIFSYKIGQLLTKVDGRNLSFNRNSPAASEKRYVQITEIHWDIQAQSTRLVVEPL
ncbi:MAG: hypothetical protein KY476_00635 [Planctomycetes bacterium]|nr:hypothetical protein [Planctomycetota bacterium]